MNIEPTTMDPRIALIHYKDYRKKCIQHRKERLAAAQAKIAEGGNIFRRARQERSVIENEDQILMESYKALSKGNRIINVADVIRTGGLDARRLPKLAIGGADWKFCHIHHDHNRIAFAEDYWLGWDYNRSRFKQDARHRNISFLAQGFHAELTDGNWRRNNNHPALNGQTRAIVPSIPPHLRPAGDLSEYQILWEAEWKTEAPKDPLLLRHIAGNMYSVLAQWDLTDLERDVLEGRIS
jgi:hypothetical protein